MMIIDFLFCPRQHALFTIYILLQINNILGDLCLKKISQVLVNFEIVTPTPAI